MLFGCINSKQMRSKMPYVSLWFCRKDRRRSVHLSSFVIFACILLLSSMNITYIYAHILKCIHMHLTICAHVHLEINGRGLRNIKLTFCAHAEDGRPVRAWRCKLTGGLGEGTSGGREQELRGSHPGRWNKHGDFPMSLIQGSWGE